MSRRTVAAQPAPPVDAVIADLRSLGSEKNRAGMARYGINTTRAFGVSVAALTPIARRLGRNHELALALWKTGYHEARLLAAFIDEPAKVTARQMDAWAADFDSWDLCDQACLKLFVKTPFAFEKIRAWVGDEREFVRRAGFSLMACTAVHGKKEPDATFIPFLDLIERQATDERNFVRKSVNWALRQIGKRSPALHRPALALAERLAASDDRTARWIGRDAVKELSDPRQIERVDRKAGR
jgi:3-methyladenine DNA glycosylase AlkD